jgi:predicted NAD-dependent protein-ADP-ribosyltransferase YbiA (DUF1768 family)
MRGHAWVELAGNVVFDGVLQRFYNKQGYEQVLLATPDARYTPKEAAQHYLTYKGFYGPWHLLRADRPNSTALKPSLRRLRQAVLEATMPEEVKAYIRARCEQEARY